MMIYLQFILIITLLKSVICYDGHVCYCVRQELDSLKNPIHLEAVNINGEHIYFIAEQTGYINKYQPGAVNRLTTYIDIHDKIVVENKFFEERGLLGFALHPDFAENSRLFLYTTRMLNSFVYVVISEIQDKRTDTEKIILMIKQYTDKRNGGQLLFGRDGYLYVFVGDGGSTDNNDSQNGNSFLGKVLRINVDQSDVIDDKLQHYTVPDDNPKLNDWRPEVYAMGGRNMWRCSVDKGDDQGRIFCGDLGSNYAEELNMIEKGGNYGWNIKEGNQCLNPSNCSTISNEVLPIQVFNHADSNVTAIVGGPVYRGSSFPGLYGGLVYGDFASGNIFTLEDLKNNNTWKPHSFPQCDQSKCGCDVRDIRRTHLLSFAESHSGELFLLMTDELNPHSPRGALLSLHQPVSDDDVTCGSVSFRVNILTVALLVLLPGIS